MCDVEGGVVLRLYYNGALTYERRWETRALALEGAAQKRLDLEREDWIPHW